MNLIRTTFYCVLFFLLLQTIQGQEHLKNSSVTGYWKGFILLLNPKTLEYKRFKAEMRLQQIGEEVTGSFFDYSSLLNVFCIYNIKGKQTANEIFIETENVEVQKQHPDYVHVLLNYHFKFTKQDVLEGTAEISNKNEYSLESKEPIRLFFSRVNTDYLTTEKYKYSLFQTTHESEYETIENKINTLLKEQEKVAKKKETKVSSSVTKNKKQKQDTEEQQSVEIIQTFKSEKLSVQPNLQKRQPHTTARTDDQQDAIAIDLDEDRIDLFKELIKINKSVRLLNDFCFYKKVINNKYILDFADSVVFFSIQGMPNQKDTLSLFVDNNLVDPLLILDGNKKVHYRIDINKNLPPSLFFSNLGTMNSVIKFNIHFGERKTRSVYDLNINNAYNEKTRISLYYNSMKLAE